MAKKKELSEEEKIDNQIIDLLMKKGVGRSAASVSATLNSMYGKVIQRLLDTEFDEYMGYDKNSHEDKVTSNRRNGSTSKGKKVKTDTGEITVVPPRDREGKFEPEIIKKRQKVLQGFDKMLYYLLTKTI